MNPAQVLTSLERERQLLEEFRSLSEQQLLLLEDEDIAGMESLLDRRADLMVELTAIETTLGTWISQIRHDPSVSSEMMQELRSVNEEIVELAKEVVAIDSETHWRLDLIRERTQAELREIHSSSRAMSGYGAGLRVEARLDIEC